MIDLKLDTIIHDLEVDAYDLQLVEDQAYIAQSLRIRLLFFLGEWFLDTSEGVPFYEDIFVKNPNLGAIEAALKARIASTPGVTDLISFSMDYDRSNRKLEVEFEVDTEFGTITISESI